MRSFAVIDRLIGHVPASVVTGLRLVDIGRGSEDLYRNQLPGLLQQLANRTRIESIAASSAIEGIVVPDPSRADRIITGRAKTLRTRSEQELAGYRDAQDYLFQKTWKPLNLGLLLYLHRLLFAHTVAPGGRFKTEDNLVVDRSPHGGVTIRFRPVPASQTEFYVAELIDRYQATMAEGHHHPVLLVGLFVIDLLTIHPFEDGNELGSSWHCGSSRSDLTGVVILHCGSSTPRSPDCPEWNRASSPVGHDQDARN